MSDVDLTHKLRTGDALLFSSNNPTGFLLRTMISSHWNHGGIAVRIKDSDLNNGKEISLDYEGELFVLEINTSPREDGISGKKIIGAGYSKASWVFRKYNRVAVRYLQEEWRTEKLPSITKEFSDGYSTTPFPSSPLSFLSIWLGVDLGKDNSMFCSELMAKYYIKIMIDTIPSESHIESGSIDTIRKIFGDECPEEEHLFRPGHFDISNMPNSSMLSNQEEIYHRSGDILFIIIQPLLITMFIAVMFYIMLSVTKI